MIRLRLFCSESLALYFDSKFVDKIDWKMLIICSLEIGYVDDRLNNFLGLNLDTQRPTFAYR